MAQKKDNSLVHGVDCKMLGSRYASALLGNAAVPLAELPELKRHSKYESLKDHEKAAVCTNIKEMSRQMLLEAGYSPAKVAEVLKRK